MYTRISCLRILKDTMALNSNGVLCISWRTTFYVDNRNKMKPSWNSSIARARHNRHTASYRSMDSFREHSRVKRQSPANCTTNCCPPRNHVSSQEDLLLALIVSERNRPLDYSGWIRARYVNGISMRVGATRTESRARERAPRDEGNVDRRSDVPLERSQSDWKKTNDIEKLSR